MQSTYSKKTTINCYRFISALFLFIAASCSGGTDSGFLRFADGTLNGWTTDNPAVWAVQFNPPYNTNAGDPNCYVVTSLGKGESGTGTLRSSQFTITHDIQKFLLAGADGTAAGTNDGNKVFLLLKSYPDGRVLRKQRPPGTHKLVPVEWHTSDLIGKSVYLELVDNNPQLNPAGYAWIGLADYHQQGWDLLKNPVKCSLAGLKIDAGAETTYSRTMPFLAISPDKRTQTARIISADTETIPVGSAAKTLYLLGMTNEGWENGVAFWPEHPELRITRDDQVYVGSKIGDVEIKYADGTSDSVPLIMGATAWFYGWWAHYPEPFKSRQDYADKWQKHTKLREDKMQITADKRHQRYFLAITPQNKVIRDIVICDNTSLRGRPMISAITLVGAMPAANLQSFGECRVDADDSKSLVKSAHLDDWKVDLEAMSDILYTSDVQLPKKVELIDFPKGLDAARIRLLGGREADMLSNIWVANLAQIAEKKFNAKTGFFRESEPGCPSYGGYTGVGTWTPVGQYAHMAFARCSDHYATVALRCLNDEGRLTSYVDYCDKYLYYYRHNHDPNQGPPNTGFDADHYPADAPPHWSFVLNNPLEAVPSSINEIPGNEEMDGHGATIVGRWYSWRVLGMPAGEWLTKPRQEIYGKSRWDSSRDAAEFICWLMDYTGRDVIYSEGEATGWGAGRLPQGMERETDPAKIKQNYANADMYEPYPTYVCMIALKCSAQMAEAVGDTKLAEKWRVYSQRLHDGMIRLLATGDHNFRTWRISPNAVLPTPQDSLVQVWFAMYLDGLDPLRLDPVMTPITRNTLQDRLALHSGYNAALGMGYGLGWLAQSALILDEMDDAGKLLTNIARYSYDKNMDYVDLKQGIDWKKWLWLVPEGTNILPDGRWHRVGDLSNGANQGIVLHAIEQCAGIDDTNPKDLKIMPRVPRSMTGIVVENFQAIVPKGSGFGKTELRYSYNLKPLSFVLKSDSVLPQLSIRLGPFSEADAKKITGNFKKHGITNSRIDISGRFDGSKARWIWIERLQNVTSIDVKESGKIAVK